METIEIPPPPILCKRGTVRRREGSKSQKGEETLAVNSVLIYLAVLSASAAP